MVWPVKRKSRVDMPRRRSLTRSFRPLVEALEDRRLPSNNALLTFNPNQFFSQGFVAVQFTVQSQTEEFGVGLLPITLSNPNGTNPQPEFESLCADALQALPDATTSYLVQPTPVASAITNGSAGEIAYLYNHYGYFPDQPPGSFQYSNSTPNPPTTTTPPTLAQAVGVQLAIWELEYGLTDSSFSFISGFESFGSTQANFNAALSYADYFRGQAQGQNENAIYLDATLGGTVNDPPGQSLLSPTPTIATSPNPTSVTLSSATPPVLKDSATLSGGPNPTGTITFTLYSPSNVLLYTDTVSVSGDGTYSSDNLGTPSGGNTLATTGTVTGTYQWDASYSGNTFNLPASDINNPNEQVVVSPASPMLMTTPNPTTVTLSNATPANLNDSAALSAGYNPTGTITFTLTYNSAVVYTDVITIGVNSGSVSGDGTYSTLTMGNHPGGYALPASGTVTGAYQWAASYGGDGNNGMASDQGGTSEQVTVTSATPALMTTPNPTTVTLSNATPANLNDSAALSAGYNPTGTITFTLTYNSAVVYTDVVTIGVNSGSVSGDGTYSTLTMGNHPGGYALPASGTVTGAYQWAASYGGDANNGMASDQGGTSEQVTVTSATPALMTTPNPTTVTLSNAMPANLNDSAALSAGYNPTGTITFTLTYNSAVVYTDVITIGVNSGSVSGDGTYSTLTMGNHPGGYALPASGTVTGAYQWAATYGGDGNNGMASDQGGTSEQVTVTSATPALMTTPNPTTVTLSNATPANLNDSAALSAGYNPTGTITFTLTYNSAVVYTDVITIGVNSGSVSGDGTYSTLTMGNHPGGYALPASGTVTGAYQWAASYGGDANNGMASDQGGTSEQVMVTSATPALMTTPNPTTVTLSNATPANLNDSAALSAGYNPTGTITFTLTYNSAVVYTDVITIGVNSGSVSGDGTYSTLTMGNHPGGYALPASGTVTGAYQWAASYGGDANNGMASDQGGTSEQATVTSATPCSMTTPNPTTVTLSNATPANLNDSAALSAGYNPTGTITFTLTYNNAVVYTDVVTIGVNSGSVSRQRHLQHAHHGQPPRWLHADRPRAR